VTKLGRIWRHLNTGTAAVRRRFPAAAKAAIEAAVREAEGRMAGEIRFAVEDALPFAALWRGQTARERALAAFGELGVWDTRDNNGVLIYVLLADRDVEIVADRGAGGGNVPPAEWERCCQAMEHQFRAGRFAEGALAGIAAVADVIARHAPGAPDVGDELPNPPAVL
jgi:uncharacterized membrane protein